MATIPSINRNQINTSLNFLWLEITGKCNLSCGHCYAGSSPAGTHGAMTDQDWIRVIEQAADLGCKRIQFIGGEPTVHPQLNHFIRLAKELEMRIEVYTNLVSIKDSHWETFQDCRVNIATSFYTSNSTVHEQITQGQHSWRKTVENIQGVLSRGLPLRVGIIDMRPDQEIDETQQFLRNMGVQRIRVDHTRGVGRGAELVQITHRPEDELCGACAHGKAAVIPDGRVFPCVFSRHLTIGNVRHSSLQDILHGEKMQQTREKLTRFFRQKFQSCMPQTEAYMVTQDLSSAVPQERWCNPNCEPHECNPNCEPGECNPDLCQPSHLCIPDFKDPCSPAKPCDPDQESCSPEWNKCAPEDR